MLKVKSMKNMRLKCLISTIFINFFYFSYGSENFNEEKETTLKSINSPKIITKKEYNNQTISLSSDSDFFDESKKRNISAADYLLFIFKIQKENGNIADHFLSNQSSNSKLLDDNQKFNELLEQGKRNLKSQHFQEALNNINKAIKMGITSRSAKAEALTDRGTSNLNLGNYESAKEDFNKALRIKEISRLAEAEALTGRGISNLNLGNYESAKEDFNKALRIKEISRLVEAEALTGRGNAKIRLKQHQEAIIDFNSALEISKSKTVTRANAFIGRGFSKSFLGQYEAAIIDLDKSLQLKNFLSNKRLAEIHTELAKLYKIISIL